MDINEEDSTTNEEVPVYTNIDHKRFRIVRKNKDRIASSCIFLVYENCHPSWTKEFLADSLIYNVLIHRRGPLKRKTKVIAWAISEAFNINDHKNI